MPGQLGRSQFFLISKKCLVICHLPLLSLAQTWVPGPPPPNPKITIRIRLLQWLHDSGRGSTRALGLPQPWPPRPRFQPLWILDPMKHCSLPVCACACVRACLCAPDPLLGPIQAPSLGRLSGFQSLSCNQENGVFETTVGWILQVLPAVSAFEGQDGFGRARWLHHCRGYLSTLKTKRKTKKKKSTV